MAAIVILDHACPLSLDKVDRNTNPHVSRGITAWHVAIGHHCVKDGACERMMITGSGGAWWAKIGLAGCQTDRMNV
ncbi:MAG: hypothetical protein KDE63_08725 [Novosphingobium sp.]|nr:hypothetical protein [Novosphingobium sp.]